MILSATGNSHRSGSEMKRQKGLKFFSTSSPNFYVLGSPASKLSEEYEPRAPKDEVLDAPKRGSREVGKGSITTEKRAK